MKVIIYRLIDEIDGYMVVDIGVLCDIYQLLIDTNLHNQLD